VLGNGGAEIRTIAAGIAVTCAGNQDLLLPPAGAKMHGLHKWSIAKNLCFLSFGIVPLIHGIS
jgi:hypothetical protein